MPVLGRATLELNADSAKLEQDLGRAVSQAAAFGTALGQVLGQAVSAGVEKLTAMVNKAIETGDELNKLSQKTGMTVEYLSQLRVAAELSNVSLNTLKTGVKQLYENLSQAGRTDGKAKSALEAIGLDVEKLRALKPDELFRTVTEQLAKYEDGANRSALQTAILGKSGAELTPLINELQKSTDLASKLGITMDKETAEAAERFKDSMTVSKIASEAMGMRIAQVLLPSLEKMSAFLVENAKNTERLDIVTRIADGGLKALATVGTIIGTAFGIAADKIGGMAAAVVMLSKGEVVSAMKALAGTYTAPLTKIGEAVDDLGRIWGDAGNKAVAGAEVNGAKLAAPAIEATKKIKAARKEADVEFQAFLKIRAIEEETGAATQDFYRKQGEQIERNGELMRKQAEDTAAIVTQAMYDAQTGKGIAFDEDTSGFLDKIKKKVEDTNDFARQMGLTFSSAFESAALGGKKLSEVLKGLGNDIAAVVLRKSVTEPLGNAISGAVNSSGIGDWFKGLFRADGGPVSAGSPYIVGERGPELFVPGMSGAILPNGAIGGGGPVFHINMPGATLEAVQRLEAMVVRLNGSIEPRAIAAVADQQLRGNRV